MAPLRSILAKEIWSRRTDKRIAWWTKRILLLVVLVYAGFSFAIWSIGFVGSKWFTASGRKETQGWLDRAERLRSGSEADIRGTGMENVGRILDSVHRDTVLDFKFELKGQALVDRAVTCRQMELAVAKFPDSPKRERVDELRTKECAQYERDAKSLREELKITPTFRF